MLGANVGAEVIQFQGCKCLRGDELVERDLFVEGGRIVAATSTVDRVVDAHGMIVSPGFIDIQTNGSYGIDLTAQPDGVDQMADRLPEQGVTSFLATLVSAPAPRYAAAIPRLRQAMERQQGARLLGLHLEGPFLSRDACGAHDTEHMPTEGRQIGGADMLECYGDLEGVRIVTLAPECVDVQSVVAELVKRGIVVSAGHTRATEGQMRQAMGAGLSLATHLFNAQSPLHHRDTGVVSTVLESDSLAYSMIPDGQHVNPQVIRIAFKANPNLIAVTDAMAAAGLADGEYSLGCMLVRVKDGVARSANTGCLAGSTATMDQAIRVLFRDAGLPLAEALKAATWRPAKLLGIEEQKGDLREGSDADLVILAEDSLEVMQTWIAGELVYQADVG